MSKKINDNSYMVEEWFSLYYSFTCYLKFLLSIMLSRRAETIDSFKSELIDDGNIGTNNRSSLVKYNISGENCNNLIMIEICVDHLRHKFDSVQHSSNYQNKNPNAVIKQDGIYKKFLNETKENKKDILLSIINLFEKANLNEDNMKLLENMIMDNYNKTTN